MRRLLALLSLVTATTQAATNDTSWQYTPYSNEVNDIQIFRKSDNRDNPLIWLGTSHGVVRIKGTDTLWLHPTNSALPSETIDPNTTSSFDRQATFTALDSSGNYWIGYKSLHKLVRIDTLGHVTVIDSSAMAPIKDLGGLSATRTNIYFGNQDGTVYSRGITSTGPWTLVSGTSVLDVGIRLTAITARNDTLWAGYEGDANGNLRHVPLTSGTPGRFISSTGEKVVGSVYGIWHSEAATDNAMFLRVSSPASYGYLNDDTLFTVRGGKVVSKSFEDESGSLVYLREIGGYPAFLKASGSFMLATATSFQGGGSFPTRVQCGVRDTGLSFLMGTNELTGFYRLIIARGNGWSNKSYGPSLRGTKIVSSTSSSNGTLYIATDSAVYQRTDAEPMMLLSRIYSTTNATIRSLSLDSSGKLNIGQSNGLYKWSNGSASYVTAMSDSILAMAHSKTYSWYLTRTTAGITKLWLYTAGVTAPSQVLLTGIGTDSTLITKMRALEDNTLWVLANGKIYTWTTLDWKNWTGIAITGKGPGSGKFYNFDLKANNLWTTYQGFAQISSYSWGVAGMANNSLIASEAGHPTAASTYAESDATAWAFVQRAAGMYGSVYPSELLKMSSVDKKVVSSYSSTFTGLHNGEKAPGESLFSDHSNGLWVVMTEGVSRMKVTPQPVGIARRPATPAFATLQAGKLLFSLEQPTSVHLEIIDLSGRVLERRNLGLLSEGAHAIVLPKATGLHILNIKAGERSETLRLPSF